MTHLEEYWQLIEKREVVAGYWIKKQIRNLIEDLDKSKYIYDTAEAEKRIRFTETMCLQSKAPYYMKPMILMPWEKAWTEVLYSFRMADTGLRRFLEALLEIARKNGKSSLLASDANYDLFCGPGGTDICCASNDDKQAKIIWREVDGMRKRIDPKKALCSANLTEIRNDLCNIMIFRMSSKTENKDGFNISKVLHDESHDIAEENAKSEIYEACWRAMSTKDEPIYINCTTQGFNRGCFLDKRIEHMKGVIEGEIDDEHALAFLFEQDSEAEIWRDKRTWEKSNPSLRYGVKKLTKLERDVELAKHDKATRIHLLTKDFNIPQASDQSWLMLEDYDYQTQPIDLEKLRGSFLLGAVDLSATTDLSNAKALVMLPGDKTKYVLTHYWIPESKLELSPDKDAGAEYLEWARYGSLTICEGTENDLTQVADWFYQLFKTYGLKPYMIGYDQRYAKVFIDRCSEYSFETELLAQGRALSNAMKLTEADLKSRRINYGGDPIDKWCLGNTCCEVDGVGNIKPRKAAGQPARRIDGGVTLIMLEEMYRRHMNDYLKLIGER